MHTLKFCQHVRIRVHVKLTSTCSPIEREENIKHTEALQRLHSAILYSYQTILMVQFSKYLHIVTTHTNSTLPQTPPSHTPIVQINPSPSLTKCPSPKPRAASSPPYPSTNSKRPHPPEPPSTPPASPPFPQQSKPKHKHKHPSCNSNPDPEPCLNPSTAPSQPATHDSARRPRQPKSQRISTTRYRTGISTG